MNNIFIRNKGKLIEKTNYWDSTPSKKGFLYLSWNASAGRLLIPDLKKWIINDIKTAKMVIVSRGIWHNRDALELLFEDNSDHPFSVHLVSEQTDRLIPNPEQGNEFVITAWTREGQVSKATGKYRVVEKLPCLEPWMEQ